MYLIFMLGIISMVSATPGVYMARCTSEEDCDAAFRMICKSGRCVCKPGDLFFEWPKYGCFSKVHMFGPCEVSGQCIALNANTYCNPDSLTCTCLPNYFFNGRECALRFPDPRITEGMFEGDMLILNRTDDRNAVPLDSQRWPGGIIPFVISEVDGDKKLVAEEIKNIYTSMRLIMAKTCIRFVQRTTEKGYILFFPGKGCWSVWGYSGREQPLSLDEGCGSISTISHELMHAIGFQHEHNRPDRDDYVTIHWDAILEGWFHAFDKYEPHQIRMLTPFDYNSVTMYGSNAFVKQYGVYGMTDKKGNYLPDDQPGLSEADVRRVNMLYECPDNYPR